MNTVSSLFEGEKEDSAINENNSKHELLIILPLNIEPNNNLYDRSEYSNCENGNS